MSKITAMCFPSDSTGTILAKLVSIVEGSKYCYRPIEIYIKYGSYYAKSLQLQENAVASIPAYNKKQVFSYGDMCDEHQIILLDKKRESYLENKYGWHHPVDYYMAEPLVFSKEINFTGKDHALIAAGASLENEGFSQGPDDDYFTYVQDFVNFLIDYSLSNNKYVSNIIAGHNIPMCTLTEEELANLLKEFISQRKDFLTERRDTKLKKIVDDFYAQNTSPLVGVLGDFPRHRKKTVPGDTHE